MKNHQILNVYYFAVVVFVALLIFGCKTKYIKDSTVTNSEKVDTLQYYRIIERNNAINDSLKIVIGNISTGRKECDSVCQIAIDNLLSQLNTKKTSGSNSSSVAYDKAKKELNVNTSVGETESDSINYKQIIFRTKTVYSHRDVPVDKPLRNWQKFLMILGAATLGILIYKLTMFVRSKVPA